MFINANDFGFSPTASALENSISLQHAVDNGGTIEVVTPGVYEIGSTVFLTSNTTLKFGNNVFLKKSNDVEPFTHLFLNRGALTKEYNEHITIDGLHLIVNGVDKAFDMIHGLRGQIAFYYIKDLNIRDFRCLDVAKAQFCIHISNFEDVLIENVIIKGDKDGVHFGPGKNFAIRDAKFETFDDAIALNAQDYSSSNPELGWIENGTIENCYDLAGNYSNGDKPLIGFFCRLLAGSWLDWQPNMKVQQSDTVIANGRLYRVQMAADGAEYISQTQPSHESGQATLDGIVWGVIQDNVIYDCGVRNVIFRNLFMEKKRITLGLLFDNDKYNRSYYPNSKMPVTKDIIIDNLNILHDSNIPLLEISSPLEDITIVNSRIKHNSIICNRHIGDLDYGATKILFNSCRLPAESMNELLVPNGRDVKIIESGCIHL